MRHNPALDGIRGLSILAVMGFHTSSALAPGGAVGVDVFFTLSGLLITSLLLAELAERGEVDWGSFYLRRAFRLLPALVVFLGLIAPVVALLIGTGRSVGQSTLKVALYLSDFAAADVWWGPISDPYRHTWSLAVEEQFYLVWPLLLLWLWRRSVPLTAWAGLLVALSIVVSRISLGLLGTTETYFLPSGHMSALTIGVLAACLTRGSGVGLVATLLGDWRSAVAGWAVLCCWTLTALPAAGADRYVVKLAILASLLTIHLHAQRPERDRLHATLASRPLVWLGRRSYGLYLYHSALIYVFVGPITHLPTSINALCALLLGMFIADLSYRALERPIRNWGRSWDDQRRARKEHRAPRDACPADLSRWA
jgi:peptidoglycan/LPS O-acetylase OafA/YrhL